MFGAILPFWGFKKYRHAWADQLMRIYFPVEFSKLFSVLWLASFGFSYCSWCSQVKNAEVVSHSLLQWTTFCQNSPPWPVHLGSPYTATTFLWKYYIWNWKNNYFLLFHCHLNIFHIFLKHCSCHFRTGWNF